MVLLFAGVATAYVGEGSGYDNSNGDGTIQIVQRGPGVIDRADLPEPQYWGTYSAAQVWGNKMWFAVVIPQDVNGEMKHGSWISAVDL